MPEVTYDDRSYKIDGKRVWLVSGSIHYFRIPHQLWRDRLLKAKRAGLNCITTYIAWNFHEPKEGEWDFSGDRDIAAFIRLAGELGLYVILRPGPYICAEWDFGGLPGWLTTKSGIAYRTNNAAYMHYFDKYFSKVLPQLASLQITRGGNIILIQNENEYNRTTMPERQEYLDFISKLIHRAGFDIPVITCNLLTDPPLEKGIDCVNGFNRVIEDLKRLRLRQPNAPAMVTEFWVGWFDYWGGKHPDRVRGDRESARKAMEILGCGAQYNYYMWHGGTNFDFWSGRLVASDGAFQTTSYDYDAPLAEGGCFTDKFYYTHMVDMTANHMGRFIAACKADTPGVTACDGLSVLNTSGTEGRWAVVSNGGNDKITTANISLHNGLHLDVPLGPIGAMAIGMDLQLNLDSKLDYANCTPLGLFGENILVLHAPADWEAVVSVNGKVVKATVPDGYLPVLVNHEGLKIVLISSQCAMRTWWVDDTLIFGPDFVGETAGDIVDRPGAKQYAAIGLDGDLKKIKATATKPAKQPAPRLGQWKLAEVCPEPADKNLKWRSISGPKDVDSLGIHYGYVWYRIEIEMERARTQQLFLPDCADRATLFLNGTRIGVWGSENGEPRVPIRAAFKKGKNVLKILADNMGRVCFGLRLGEKKGLFGHIYDSKPLRASAFKVKQLDSFSKRMIPRAMTHLIAKYEQLPVWEATADINLTSVVPVHFQFADWPYDVAVTCNDRLVGFLPADNKSNHGQLKFHTGLKAGKNKIKLTLWGDVDRNHLRQAQFHLLAGMVTDQAAWSFRPWEVPLEPNGKPARKGSPAWFTAKFKYSGGSGPLFLKLAGASKGQIYLNGQNLGRFWSIGPQACYYLPECWLRPSNELLIFDEMGQAPIGSKLEFRLGGTYQAR